MKQRSFFPQDFVLNTWEDIQPYIQQLMDIEFSNKHVFMAWLDKKNELEALISEDFAWRYIHNSCHTDNQEYREKYLYFVQHLSPLFQER